MKSSLMLREPEFSFDSFHQELNNFLKDMFSDEVFSPSHMNLKKPMVWRPAIEMNQNDKEYMVKIQLPGVNKEDINVELENDFMKVSAEMHEEKHEKSSDKADKNTHMTEFRYGKYIRTISFDNPIKANESTAEYKDGVLCIAVPKQKIEKIHAKRLTIK